MNFVEFLECVARISEDFSPHASDFNAIEMNGGKELLWDKRRDDYDPWIKLEGMCKILLLRCCDKELKETFPPMEISHFGGNPHYMPEKGTHRAYNLLTKPFKVEPDS